MTIDSTTLPAKGSFNSIKTLFLLLAIAGSIAPWFWLLQDPSVLLSPSLFFQRAFANNVTLAFSEDLIISAIAFLCWAWIELKRLKVSRSWLFLYVGLTFGIGLSCALPVFLYRREQILEQTR
jgi:hypothetical protein